ncbi:MAG: glycosyltransferase family 2 protein [Clostridia bacterium]|nr:glycosyltransferase family 2 protein [Clostridia bacterium]
MAKDGIAGVVVLYHPDDTVIENIKTYLWGLDVLFAVDNTEVQSPGFLKELEKLKKIVYIENKDNLGIAKALNQGVERSIKEGYSWVLTMDQDSSFTHEMFTRYLDEFHKLKGSGNIAILSPVQEKVEEAGRELVNPYEECLVVMTSGNLLNTSIFKSIGGFEEKLFIDEVDHDYCLKANLAGYKVIKLKTVLLNHKLGETQSVQKGGRSFTISTHSPRRMYYITRNNLYMWKKYKKACPGFIKERKNYFIHYNLKNILYYEDKKIPKLACVVKGFFDFMRGKYGRY